MGQEDFAIDDSLTFNGLDGASGAYLLPRLTPTDLLALTNQASPDRAHQSVLQLRQRSSKHTVRDVRAGIDPLDISQAGWGVIFAEVDSEKLRAIKEALAVLLKTTQLEVIAEGVETAGQLSMLRARGRQAGSGALFFTAFAGGSFPALLRAAPLSAAPPA